MYEDVFYVRRVGNLMKTAKVNAYNLKLFQNALL